MAFAARTIEVLALVNLGLAIAATLAGHRFFEEYPKPGDDLAARE